MRKRGFTLIELLIVMVIGAVMLSLVGPVTISQYERTQRLKEREQLYRLIEHSRFQSLLNRVPVELHLYGATAVLVAGSSEQQWRFEHLRFAEQILQVNGNGFWQQQSVVWQEQEQLWQLALNPAPLQYNTSPQVPVAQRKPRHD